MGARTTKEPKVNPEERVAEFPDNSLCVMSGKLFCDSCSVTLSLRKGTIRTHLSGKFHREKLQEWHSKNTRDQTHLKVGLTARTPRFIPVRQWVLVDP